MRRTTPETKTRRNRLVDELGEDIEVAIHEFLERHPDTGTRRIRQAMRLVERRTDGGRASRVASAVAPAAVFFVGLTLGLLFG